MLSRSEDALELWVIEALALTFFKRRIFKSPLVDLSNLELAKIPGFEPKAKLDLNKLNK